MVNDTPNRDEVRRILTAAADVIFSDGVSTALLDHWVEETSFLLSLQASPEAIPRAASASAGQRFSGNAAGR